VQQEGKELRVVCGCGWRSRLYPIGVTSAEVEKDFRSHVTQVFSVVSSGNTYDILRDKNNQEAIFCRRCLRISYHPADIDNKYCGGCHEFHRPACEHKVYTSERRKFDPYCNEYPHIQVCTGCHMQRRVPKIRLVRNPRGVEGRPGMVVEAEPWHMPGVAGMGYRKVFYDIDKARAWAHNPTWPSDSDEEELWALKLTH
jgi:ribosomal protein L37E